jgi:hypothetical protein
MKIKCHDHEAEINTLRSIIIGEIVSHIDSSAGMIMMIMKSTTITKETTISKDKVEIELAGKVEEDWGR